MTPLVWSKEPPTKPGWYWRRAVAGTPGIIGQVYKRGDLETWFSGGGLTHRLTRSDIVGIEWAGPIPQPAEPTGAGGDE